MLKLNLFPLWIPFFFPFEVISAKFRRLSRSHRVWNLVALLVKTLPAMQETLVQFLSWEDPLEKG